MPNHRLLCLAAAALIGLSLIAISGGRFWASAEMVPVIETLWAMEEGGRVTEPELQAAREAAARSLARNPSDAEIYDFQGLTLLALGSFAAEGSSERTELYVRARQSFRNATARAPQNSALWARLAEATVLTEGFSPAAVSAMEMSYLTGRLDFRVLAKRISLSLRYWEFVPPELREEVRRQVAAMWQRDGSRRALYPLYVNIGYAERRLLRDLMPNPTETLPKFDSSLRWWLKRRAPDSVRQRYMR